MQKITKRRVRFRKCLVCGKKIRISVCSDGHYRTGHYFGKIKLPIEGLGNGRKQEK